MSYYTPNLWVIVEVKSEHGKLLKVLGSWYGGYGGSDEWRMSSGITKIESKLDDKYPHYLIHNESGSEYTCYDNNIGMNAYTASVYENFKDKLEKIGGTIEIIDIKKCIEMIDEQPVAGYDESGISKIGYTIEDCNPIAIKDTVYYVLKPEFRKLNNGNV